jgi:hypothetical protein
MKFDRPAEEKARMQSWKAEHTTQLSELAKRATSRGWKVDVERYFRVEGKTAIVAGKADLICTEPKEADKRPLIVDAKTGKPRDSDVAQVMIEIILIPMAWSKDIKFDGVVDYAHDPVVKIQHHEAMALKPKLMKLISDLGTLPRPEPTPGRDACQFCPVPESECSARYQAEPAAKTEEF